jgi:hypothetical protein
MAAGPTGYDLAGLGEHGDDPPAVASGNGLEIAALVRDVLLERADSEVERDPSVAHRDFAC